MFLFLGRLTFLLCQPIPFACSTRPPGRERGGYSSPGARADVGCPPGESVPGSPVLVLPPASCLPCLAASPCERRWPLRWTKCAALCAGASSELLATLDSRLPCLRSEAAVCRQPPTNSSSSRDAPVGCTHEGACALFASSSAGAHWQAWTLGSVSVGYTVFAPSREIALTTRPL